MISIIPPLSRLPVWALYLICYVGLDWLSYIYAVQPLAITPWNPPPALSLILLLRYGLSNWPVVLLAAMLAEILVRETPVSLVFVLLSSMALTLTYTGVAALLLRVVRIDVGLRSLRDLSRLTVVIVPGTLLAASAYVSIYTFAGSVLPISWMNDVMRFWLGDLIGIIVLAPLLLVFLADRPDFSWFRPSLEIVLQTLSILVTLWVTFGLEISDKHKFFYPLFLPLIWIAMRHGIRGATMAVVLIQTGLILALFWTGQQVATVIDFQYLMLALAITGLFMGMAVTERQLVQNALSLREIELNQALRFAGAAEMTSALAHELNQPLAAIANYVRACEMMVESSAQPHPLLKETMGKVVREVTRAGEAVHRLRDFFRFGVLQLERQSVDTMLREAVRSVEMYSARHDVGIILRVASDLPEVWVDRVQIEIVLHNLILNAIQAIASSTIDRREVILEARPAEGEPGWVRVAVHDFGPGVAQEVAAGLFYAFSTTKTEGMGLGLAISRSLVEAHGGRLWLDGEAKSGARFCFTLPTEDIFELTDDNA